MNIAYLIISYRNPLHLYRLIHKIISDSSSCFIHIDKKSNIEEFIQLEHDKVHFSKNRIPVYWGTYSQIEAPLILLQQALEHTDTYDRFVLLSGSDYPLRSKVYIKKFFEDHIDEEFVNVVSLPNPEGWNPISRFENYNPNRAKSIFNSYLVKGLKKFGVIPKKRDYAEKLNGMTPCAGSAYWAISRKAGNYILDFIETHPQEIRFLKNVVIPSETFIQTIIGNSPFKSKAVGNLTYADWRKGGPNPAWINEEHLDLFKSKEFLENGFQESRYEYLFGRKFSDKSQKIIKAIDEIIKMHEE